MPTAPEAIRLLRIRARRKRCESLYGFVKEFWHVVEPATAFKEGWVVWAICAHLEAVTRGEINRLLINVPPGSMKSLLCNVFWPAWEWGPANKPHLRTISFSYAAHLTCRDNEKFRDILLDPSYQETFCKPARINQGGQTAADQPWFVRKRGSEKVSNSRTGWRFATSVGGVGTGERGDRCVLDDPHNVAEGESDAIRSGTVEWFRTAMSNRLNDMEASAIVVIMQRVHEDDVSGAILANAMGYVHLCVPAEYDPYRHCETVIGWEDPRRDDEAEDLGAGASFWPERYPLRVLDNLQVTLGPFGYAGQYQQSPTPKGGGIIKREWWQLWEESEFPAFDFLLGSLDTAYTSKQDNDPSALTIWGVFRDKFNLPRVMLVRAWASRLELHDLVEKVAKSCKRFRVDKLLIETKASGLSVAQELKRLHSNEGFDVSVIDPGNLDKVARAYGVSPAFSGGQVYAPDREYAEEVIAQCERFPKSKHDDLVDSTTQAINWLRRNGLLTRAEEHLAETESAMGEGGGPSEALYPTM